MTFDWVDVDVDTGEGRRGKLAPANLETFRRWLEQFGGQQVDVVVEGCTGWRFIIEECRAAGVTPHLADPAEASVRWQAAAKQVGKKRAAISVGRKLTRRCHHRLRALGDQAFAEV